MPAVITVCSNLFITQAVFSDSADSLVFISNRFHISTLDSVKDCDYAPMATGGVTNGVTVLEMTAAYATFGNGGYYYEPYCYTKIEDVQGNVVLQKQPEKTAVFVTQTSER